MDDSAKEVIAAIGVILGAIAVLVGVIALICVSPLIFGTLTLFALLGWGVWGFLHFNKNGW